MSADAAQRAQLEARRANHVLRLDQFRVAALEEWRRVAELEHGGAEPELARRRKLAIQVEQICYMLNVAIVAIDDELGERLV